MKHPQSPDFSAALVAQEPFLRRLSRGLLANELDADEAVQSTLLDAWQAKDRPASQRVGSDALAALAPERLRAWLAVTLRRKAYSLHRKDRPTESLDADPVQDHERFSPEAIIARTEHQKELFEALLQLPEASRDAIVLKFQDGMSVVQIARLRGESPDTVQSRVRRGLAALKRHLQRSTDAIDRDDNYEPWLAALIPLAFPKGPPKSLVTRLASRAAPAVTATTPSILTSLLTMGLMKHLLVAAAVLAAAGFHLQRSQPASTPPALPSASQDLAAAPMRLPTASTSDPSSQLTPREELPASDAAAPQLRENDATPAAALVGPRITGRVLFVDGLPIPGAEVIASTKAMPQDTEWGRTTSGPDGRFELTLDDDSPPESVTLTVDMGRMPSHSAGSVVVTPGARDVELRIDALLVHLVPPGGYPSVENTTRPAFLAIMAMRKRSRGMNMDSERYDAATEAAATRLIPTGPPYIFHVSHGDYSSDDQVAFLPADAPAGVYELQLAGDTPELGSVTVHRTGAQIPAGANVSMTVSMGSDKFPGGFISLANDVTHARRSGAYPGTYRITAEVSGDPPYGWVVPEVIDSPIEIRAGEDTSVEVSLRPAGMARLTVTPRPNSGEMRYQPSDDLDEYMVMYRAAGAPRWEFAALAAITESGKATPRGFPIAMEPVLIDEVLPAGFYEVQLEGTQGAVGPISFEVLEGRYSDVSIEVPNGM